MILSLNFDKEKLDFKGSSLSPYVSGENNEQINGELSESKYTIYSQFTDSTYSSVIYLDNTNEPFTGSSGNMLFLKFKPDSTFFSDLTDYNETAIITLNSLQINENSMIESKINSFSKTIKFGDCNGTLGGFQADTDGDEVCNDIDQCPDEGIDTTTDPKPVESNGCLNTITHLNLFPANYSISQNYPNPFNPTTLVDIHLPEKENLNVSIFNVTGRLVNILLNKNVEAGSYTVSWNGKDQLGQTVPTGIYFMKVVSGDQIVTKKLAYLK